MLFYSYVLCNCLIIMERDSGPFIKILLALAEVKLWNGLVRAKFGKYTHLGQT